MGPPPANCEIFLQDGCMITCDDDLMDSEIVPPGTLLILKKQDVSTTGEDAMKEEENKGK